MLIKVIVVFELLIVRLHNTLACPLRNICRVWLVVKVIVRLVTSCSDFDLSSCYCFWLYLFNWFIIGNLLDNFSGFWQMTDFL